MWVLHFAVASSKSMFAIQYPKKHFILPNKILRIVCSFFIFSLKIIWTGFHLRNKICRHFCVKKFNVVNRKNKFRKYIFSKNFSPYRYNSVILHKFDFFKRSFYTGPPVLNSKTTIANLPVVNLADDLKFPKFAIYSHTIFQLVQNI